MVGRLDVNTSGLLVFSNNGDLVQKLSHPSSMIERKYLCRIFGKPTTSQIKNLLNGARIDGKKSNLEENDVARRNTIATLMSDWGLLQIDKATKLEPIAPLRQIKIISFKDKDDWNLCPKYNIGNGSK